MTIDITTLAPMQPCPCSPGRTIYQVISNAFRCTNFATGMIWHTSLGPGGGYTNLTNVSVTPPRSRVLDYLARCPPKPPVPTSPKYPHVCPTCRGAVYVGFTAIEHAATGSARCP